MIKIRLNQYQELAKMQEKANFAKYNSLCLEHNFYSGKISPDPGVGKI